MRFGFGCTQYTGKKGKELALRTIQGDKHSWILSEPQDLARTSGVLPTHIAVKAVARQKRQSHACQRPMRIENPTRKRQTGYGLDRRLFDPCVTWRLEVASRREEGLRQAGQGWGLGAGLRARAKAWEGVGRSRGQRRRRGRARRGPSCPWSPCPTHPYQQPNPDLTGLPAHTVRCWISTHVAFGFHSFFLELIFSHENSCHKIVYHFVIKFS